MQSPQVQNILILIICFFLILVLQRYKYGKLTKEKILVLFSTDEQSGYFQWHPIKDGMLMIPPTDKRAGVEYPIGNVNYITMPYPFNTPSYMSLMQVTARITVIDERTGEPLLNRSNCIVGTPQMLWGLHNEQFTRQAQGTSRMEEEKIRKENQANAPSKPMNWKGFLIFIAIVGLAVAGYLAYQHFTGVNNAALGLP